MTNTTKPVDFTKPVKYRNGEVCRILCTDGNNQKFPVVSQTICGRLLTHTKDGSKFYSELNDNYDIIQDIQQVKKYYRVYALSDNDSDDVFVGESKSSLEKAINSKEIYGDATFVSIICITKEDGKAISSELLGIQEDKPAKASEPGEFKVGDKWNFPSSLPEFVE